MKVTTNDLTNLKILKEVIKKSKIEIQGEAVKIVSSSFLWLENLEDRFKDDLEEKTPILPTEKKEVMKKL